LIRRSFQWRIFPYLPEKYKAKGSSDATINEGFIFNMVVSKEDPVRSVQSIK